MEAEFKGTCKRFNAVPIPSRRLMVKISSRSLSLSRFSLSLSRHLWDVESDCIDGLVYPRKRHGVGR